MASTAAERRAAGPTWRREAAVLLLAWAAVTALTWLLGELLTGPLASAVRPEDDAVPRWFAAQRSAPATDVADGLTLAGDAPVAVGVALVLMLLLWWRIRQWRPVVFLAVATAGQLAAWAVTVNLVLRHRPEVRQLDPGLNPLHSYPSGHVSAAMATYGALAVLLWVLHAPHRRWWGSLLLALVALIAVARLYLGAHHPSDVLASLLFMVGWLWTCAVVLLRPSPHAESSSEPSPT